MLPSMYSGVSGLMTHQQRMNVIGNDIANVNTVGYKQSDVTFKEAFVNTLRAPAPGTPGQQVGLGVQLGMITKDFSGGALMQTGTASNLAISGNGFFVVADPDAQINANIAGGDPAFFTRAGDFVTDVQGDNTYLITSEGRRLMGIMDPNADPDNLDLEGQDLVGINLREGLDPDQIVTSYSVGLDGVVYRSVDGNEAEVLGRVAVAMFDNPNGLESIGSNLFSSTEAAAFRGFGNAGEAGTGQVFQGFLENSNVDLAREFTEMIVTQRGFQANSRSITTSDEMLGELLSLKR